MFFDLVRQSDPTSVYISLFVLRLRVRVRPSVNTSESSRDCVSEEVSGALPSLISLMVSVDVKPYVLLLLENFALSSCILPHMQRVLTAR